MEIRVLFNANDRIEPDFADGPLFCTLFAWKLDICTILSENHKEGEQIIFVVIRVLLNANNRIETDFAVGPLFLRKFDELTAHCTIFCLEIGTLHHFIGKSLRVRANYFGGYQSIILVDIRVLFNDKSRIETDFASGPIF